MKVNMQDWNTDLYLQYENGRNKPIYDLISHIPLKTAKRIINIGCGPGNSTIFLKKWFPDSEIIGMDNSINMIEKAKELYPNITWLLKDANNGLSDMGKFDIVFSNSVLHWLPNHKDILLQFFGLLQKNGVVAIQIPYFFGTPIYGPLYDLIKSKKWNTYIENKEPTTYHNLDFYYEILSTHFKIFDIWTTKHTHILNSRNDIIDWYKPTGFKPFLDQLGTEEIKKKFLNDISKIIDELYMPQKDGNFLLCFERLFFIGQKD